MRNDGGDDVSKAQIPAFGITSSRHTTRIILSQEKSWRAGVALVSDSTARHAWSRRPRHARHDTLNLLPKQKRLIGFQLQKQNLCCEFLFIISVVFFPAESDLCCFSRKRRWQRCCWYSWSGGLAVCRVRSAPCDLILPSATPYVAAPSFSPLRARSTYDANIDYLYLYTGCHRRDSRPVWCTVCTAAREAADFNARHCRNFL